MAKQKHVAPLEDSDDELLVPKPQNEQEDSSEEEEYSTSSDEDTDEGEDERDKHVLLPRKLQPQMVSKPSSSTEDESDSEPEPEPEALLESAKPTPKVKSQPSSSVSQAKSGSKRAAKDSTPTIQSKRGKKAKEDHAAGSDEEDRNKESKSLLKGLSGKSTPKKELVPHSNGKAETKSKLSSEPLDSNKGKKMSELSGTSLALTSMLGYNGAFGKPYREDYIRKGIELLGVSKRKEIEARWRKLKEAENKLYAEIAEFYAEQVKLIYQANSSSSS